MGWWDVDPVTGWTRDTDEGGFHTASTEQATGVYQRTKSIKDVDKFSQSVRCYLGIAVTVVTGMAAQVGQIASVTGHPELAPTTQIAEGLHDALAGFLEKKTCKVPGAPLSPRQPPRFGAPNMGGGPGRVFGRIPELVRRGVRGR